MDHQPAAIELTVQQEGPTHYNVMTRPYAVYPMQRGSFESAARPLWLVGGDTQRIRVEGRLRLPYTNAQMSDQELKLHRASAGTVPTGDETTRQTKALVESVRPIAVAAGVSTTRLRMQTGSTEVVRDGVPVMGVDPPAQLLWRCLSALTHGDQWATLNLLDRDEIAVSPDGGTVTLRTSSDAGTVVSFMVVALRKAAVVHLRKDRASKTCAM